MDSSSSNLCFLKVGDLMLQIIVVTIIEAKNGGSWVIEREEERKRGGRGKRKKQRGDCVFDLILLF